MKQRQILARVETAIETQDPGALAKALAGTASLSWSRDQMETLAAGATALVNWDASLLEVDLPRPLRPTAEGRELHTWMDDYLDFRKSLPPASLKLIRKGDCNALVLRQRVFELIRNLVFEIPDL